MTALASVPGAAYRQDISLWPILERLADCLCVQLAEADLPDLCFCGLLAGATVSDQMGDGTEGQAWVRVLQIYPSVAFPAPIANTASAMAGRSCDSGLAASVEMGVLRCSPVSDSNDGLTPPSADAWWEATRLQMADMAVMRRAVQCCDNGTELLMLGAYNPVGPAGGVVGGNWQLYIGEQDGPRWRR